MTHIYELVDATSEGEYYPLGLFLDLQDAILAGSLFHPGKWDNVMDDFGVSEIRQRALGVSQNEYKVLWRSEWTPSTNEWDTDWTATTQTGTEENPLLMSRA